MSSSTRSVIVTRSYSATPDACVRALELLLEKSVRKKGGPATAPEDARKDQDARTYSHST
jgi:hypothetical protein